MEILSIRGFKAVLYFWSGLIRNVTAGRLINYLKLRLSYHLAGFQKHPRHWGFPVAVSVEPTTACNLQCPECPTGRGTLQRPAGKLSIEQFDYYLQKLPREVSWLTFYFQGEPFLNRNFIDMVKLAKKRRMIVTTSTNGHFLNLENATKAIESGLDKIIISLDGADADTYLNYRKGGSFDKVVEGIKQLTAKKKELGSHKPLVCIQFLVFKQNEHQLEAMTLLSRELGADVLEFKTAQHYDFEEGSPYMTSLDKYSRYRLAGNGKYAIKNKLHNRCWRMWSSSVITWDGKVVPCCYDKDASYCFGNLQESGFEEIWKGAEADKFRRQLLHSRKDIEICRNCHE
ncbi:MAG: SPASM domain-containing protein [Bacteroidales bacterium]|nr:SPASM domain-containing protein [Bacteroidales bacterium]